ncbi:MAG: hypothetical protein KQA36_02025, partial [Candidatus Aenigmarchaeota archaeon]|nr:hypothetical protein [Candidatus Aenigmarchaeota archaeon]
PKKENIENPGFIIEKIDHNQNREIFIPEMLFCDLESRLKNRKILYIIGKNYGNIYSLICNFPTKNTTKNLSQFIYFLVRAVESIYANLLSHEARIPEKIFILRMKDYIICRKNGLGYIFSEGGIAGIWAYACQDPSIEAIQIKCQGRGDKECEVIAAPYKTLVRMGYKPIRCKKLEKGKLTPEYKIFNEIRPTSWARNSLKSLIDAGFFDYKHGQVTYRGERFFLCEASFMYILEKELKKIKNGLKILWDCSFDFGKRLAEISGKQEPCKFIMDFFPALGFGDILALKKKGRYEIFVKYFPWLEWYKDIDFTMFRGMLSGVISGFTGEKVELKKVEKSVSSGYFSLFITQ